MQYSGTPQNRNLSKPEFSQNRTIGQVPILQLLFSQYKNHCKPENGQAFYYILTISPLHHSRLNVTFLQAATPTISHLRRNLSISSKCHNGHTHINSASKEVCCRGMTVVSSLLNSIRVILDNETSLSFISFTILLLM